MGVPGNNVKPQIVLCCLMAFEMVLELSRIHNPLRNSQRNRRFPMFKVLWLMPLPLMVLAHIRLQFGISRGKCC